MAASERNTSNVSNNYPDSLNCSEESEVVNQFGKSMCHKPIFAIIIPVYNGERYISDCLNSLLNQSYPHWLAICVNDGSTDNSYTALQQYAEKDSRIRVYNKDNGGVSRARNHALNQLEYEDYDWLTFLDIDDMYAPYHLQDLADLINVFPKVEYIRTHCHTFLTRDEMKDAVKDTAPGVKRRYDVLNTEQYFKSGDVGGMIATCTLRRSLINRFSYRLPEDMKLMEDQVFSIKYALKAKVLINFHDDGYICYSPVNAANKYTNTAKDAALCINKVFEEVKKVKSQDIVDYFEKVYFPTKINMYLSGLWRGSELGGVVLNPDIKVWRYCKTLSARVKYIMLKIKRII